MYVTKLRKESLSFASSYLKEFRQFSVKTQRVRVKIKTSNKKPLTRPPIGKLPRKRQQQCRPDLTASGAYKLDTKTLPVAADKNLL